MKIETERLLLRPFTTGDSSDLLEYLHTPTVHCFACMKVSTPEEAEKGVAERMQDELYFAIVLKETGKVIGEIFAHSEATDPTNTARDTYSPCWMLNPAYQGQGYMYEAAHAFFDTLFHEMGARRIYLYTEDDNFACQKLSEKLGMRQEGLFREFVTFVNDDCGNPIYENTYQYAILKKEWDAR